MSSIPSIEVMIMISSSLGPDMPQYKNLSRRLKTEQQQIKGTIDHLALLIQHGTTSYKIIFAKNCLEKMREIYPKLSMIPQPSQQLVTYLFELDTFFFVLHSGVDSFFREVNLIYGLGLRDPKIKDWRVIKQINSRFPQEKITHLLKQETGKKWYKHFTKTRNHITHRTTLAFKAPVVPGKIIHTYLPDNPDAQPTKFTYHEEIEVIPYCEEVLLKTVDLLETGCRFMEERLFG